MDKVGVPILGYEKDYSVTENGRVYSHIQNRWLAPKLHTGGYLRVALRGKDKYIHRLVGVAYLGEPLAGQYINHIDGDKTNNSVKNLEWCTAKQNTTHAIKNGLWKNPKGHTHHWAKFSDETVAEIRKLKGEYSQYEVSRMFGTSRPYISMIWNNKERVS